jgi:hypothetical protein
MPEPGHEMVRGRVLESGKSARIEDRCSVDDGSKRMASMLTAWVEGEERVSIRRVLRTVDE